MSAAEAGGSEDVPKAYPSRLKKKKKKVYPIYPDPTFPKLQDFGNRQPLKAKNSRLYQINKGGRYNLNKKGESAQSSVIA